jgi:hypothetical protein
VIDPHIMRRMAPALAAAGALTGSIAGGVLLGLGIDAILGSGPVFTGLLAFGGLYFGVKQAARLGRPTS